MLSSCMFSWRTIGAVYPRGNSSMGGSWFEKIKFYKRVARFLSRVLMEPIWNSISCKLCSDGNYRSTQKLILYYICMYVLLYMRTYPSLSYSSCIYSFSCMIYMYIFTYLSNIENSCTKRWQPVSFFRYCTVNYTCIFSLLE